MGIDEKDIQRYVNAYTTCEGLDNLTIEQLRIIAVTSITLTYDSLKKDCDDKCNFRSDYDRYGNFGVKCTKCGIRKG